MSDFVALRPVTMSARAAAMGGQADRACGLQFARLGQLAGELRDLLRLI